VWLSVTARSQRLRAPPESAEPDTDVGWHKQGHVMHSPPQPHSLPVTTSHHPTWHRHHYHHRNYLPFPAWFKAPTYRSIRSLPVYKRSKSPPWALISTDLLDPVPTSSRRLSSHVFSSYSFRMALSPLLCLSHPATPEPAHASCTHLNLVYLYQPNPIGRSL